ncbi:hypothetical protein BCPG3_079 [Bacillus phage BCPG3]|uniref:DUF7336 domain-containing protein n=2 Tax=Wphvirus TaxID=1922327 RepID=W5QUI2_9CAUD|nr:hypothetical protein BPS13_0072 [Bacillus phage BPS13]YP_009002957.1 hypothetical protein BPS10C_071 [Bacillus phage BPS10C]AEZ50251.1 hypothetical protein BPS13_0072 [Bacillus phage BPS13]AGI12068.1 hypothetical protein BPS10C_071 [Bacillus phage BPS10C]QSJ04396.1 hypothetical protein BCPG3_079 [Bacillus phage BCPG3]
MTYERKYNAKEIAICMALTDLLKELTIKDGKIYVYIVTSDYGYDTNDFEGVYSTEEKAKARCDKANKDLGGNIFSYEEYYLNED